MTNNAAKREDVAMRIGMIGAGRMGANLVRRLMRADHECVVYDVDAGAVNGITSYCLRRSHNRTEEANNPDTAVIWIDNLTEIRRRHLTQKEAAK